MDRPHPSTFIAEIREDMPCSLAKLSRFGVCASFMMAWEHAMRAGRCSQQDDAGKKTADGTAASSTYPAVTGTGLRAFEATTPQAGAGVAISEENRSGEGRILGHGARGRRLRASHLNLRTSSRGDARTARKNGVGVCAGSLRCLLPLSSAGLGACQLRDYKPILRFRGCPPSLFGIGVLQHTERDV